MNNKKQVMNAIIQDQPVQYDKEWEDKVLYEIFKPTWQERVCDTMASAWVELLFAAGALVVVGWVLMRVFDR